MSSSSSSESNITFYNSRPLILDAAVSNKVTDTDALPLEKHLLPEYSSSLESNISFYNSRPLILDTAVSNKVTDTDVLPVEKHLSPEYNTTLLFWKKLETEDGTILPLIESKRDSISSTTSTSSYKSSSSSKSGNCFLTVTKSLASEYNEIAAMKNAQKAVKQQ